MGGRAPRGGRRSPIGRQSPPGSAAAGAPGPGRRCPAPALPQDSTLSEDSPPPSASPRLPGPPGSRCSYPYHTLSQSSDEVSAGPGSPWGRGDPADRRPRGSSRRSRPARPRAGRAGRWGSGWRGWAWGTTASASRPTAWTGRGCCASTAPSSRYGAGGLLLPTRVPATPTGSAVGQEVLGTPTGCSLGQGWWVLGTPMGCSIGQAQVGSRYPNGLITGHLESLILTGGSVGQWGSGSGTPGG